jgi:hypothetical protein
MVQAQIIEVIRAELTPICVELQNGKTITLDVDLSDTIEKVEQKIRDKERIPPDVNITLYFADRVLRKSSTLTNYNIQKGSTLRLEEVIFAQVAYVAPKVELLEMKHIYVNQGSALSAEAQMEAEERWVRQLSSSPKVDLSSNKSLTDDRNAAFALAKALEVSRCCSVCVCVCVWCVCEARKGPECVEGGRGYSGAVRVR